MLRMIVATVRCVRLRLATGGGVPTGRGARSSSRSRAL